MAVREEAPRYHSSGVGRRDFMQLLAAAGALAGLTGCQVQTSVPQVGQTTGVGLQIPDAAKNFPSGQVSLRFLDGGPGPKSYFFDQFLAAYEEKHPNVTVQHDELPNQKIAELLPLQLRNGDVSELIFVPPNVPLSQLVASGHLAPLDDVIPDFGQWKENVPFGILVAGIEVFDGKTYAVAPGSNRRSTLLLHNSEYMNAAGYDPASEPLTWDDFRTAAKKITQAGNGDYYGLITPGVYMGVVFNLSELAGVHGSSGFDWKTGQYNFHADEMIALIELLQAIQADGSLFPGWASLKDEEARAQMAQGAAGMLMSGPWNFPVWKEQNPDFGYGVSRLPAPSDHGDLAAGYEVGGSNWFSVYSKAGPDQTVVAGDMLRYLGTENGQRAWGTLTGAADPPWSSDVMGEIIDSGELDEPNSTALKIFEDTVRLAPSPLIRNPDNQQVQLALVAAKPNLGQVVQGILTGELTDPAAALRELSSKSEKALEDAIATAVSQGAAVSRDDWVFPDWDPSRDFGEADY